MTAAYYLSVVCWMCQQAWTRSSAITVHVIKKKKKRTGNLKDVGTSSWRALLKSPCDMPKCYLHKCRI